MTTPLPKEQLIQKFANESPCICFNIRKAARAITQVYDDLFKDIGLTASQISILNSLKIIGPMTVSELAEAMSTDRTTITRNLKPLQRDKYIKIQTGSDRRSRIIANTPKGEDTTKITFAEFQKFQSKLDKSIGSEKVQQLCQDLAKTIAVIQEK